jgi:hypothetical protein
MKAVVARCRQLMKGARMLSVDPIDESVTPLLATSKIG